jgi:membrane protein required for colicin V production
MSFSFLDGISWVDAVVVLVVVIFGVIGLSKGAIRFIVSLATVVVGIALAGTFGESLGAQHWPLISDATNHKEIGVLVGCALVFAGTLLVGALVSKVLRAAAEKTDLGGMDRMFGLLFGVLRGILWSALLVTVLMFIEGQFSGLSSLHSALEGSFALSMTRELAEVCGGWFPAPMGEWLVQTLELPAGDVSPLEIPR